LNNLQKFVIHRLLLLVPTVFGSSIVVFLVIHLLPGDVITYILADSPTGVDPAIVALWRQRLGLNLPIYQQYLNWFGGILTGNFGYSSYTGQPIFPELASAFQHTFILAIAAMMVAIAIGITSGMVAAIRQNRIADYLVTFFSTVGLSIPSFWLGLMLILFFAIDLKILPAVGDLGWKSLILPAVVLGIYGAGGIGRVTRSSVIDELEKDYVKAARARGAPLRVIYIKHVLRNAAIPIVTLISIQFGYMLSGAVIVENVFSWPGLGKMMVTAIQERDVPVVQAGAMVIALVFIVINLVTDILYAYINPRIRY
jgi:peptide/nickel transport system permease protein